MEKKQIKISLGMLIAGIIILILIAVIVGMGLYLFNQGQASRNASCITDNCKSEKQEQINNNNNILTNKIGNTASNISSGGYMAQKDNWIYYSLKTANLYKMKINSNQKEVLYSSKNGEIMYINVVDDYIYFIDKEFYSELGHEKEIDINSVCKIKNDGTGFEKIDEFYSTFDPLNYFPVYMCVVDDTIYYQGLKSENPYKEVELDIGTGFVDDTVINKINVNGKQKETLRDYSYDLCYVKDKEHIYVFDKNSKKIKYLDANNIIHDTNLDNSVIPLFRENAVYSIKEKQNNNSNELELPKKIIKYDYEKWNKSVILDISTNTKIKEILKKYDVNLNDINVNAQICEYDVTDEYIMLKILIINVTYDENGKINLSSTDLSKGSHGIISLLINQKTKEIIDLEEFGGTITR